MKATKVVHLTSVHSPFDSRIFQKECRSLVQAGYSVSLVAPHRKREKLEGVTIIPFAREHRRAHRMTGTVRRVVDLAAREQAVVYHLHDPELLPWCGPLKRGGGIVVYDMHEDLPHQIKSKRWVPRPLRRVTAALVKAGERVLLRDTPTVFAEKSYSRNRAWMGESVDVLNYPRVEFLGQMRRPIDLGTPFTVGYLGTVTPERGSMHMLAALAKVQFAGYDVAFECIGKIPRSHHAELSTLVKELGLKGVHLVGYLPPEEGWKRMAAWDLGLAVLEPIPNYLESYPTKIFEYMSMGIPAVVSDFPLYRQIIAEHQCGILVNPLDAGALATAIIRMMENPDEAAEMGTRGIQAARAHYSWESEGEKLVAFYGRILRARGLTPPG